MPQKKTNEKSVQKINSHINASIEELQNFFLDEERTRYIYAASQFEITRYLEKLKALLVHVLRDITNSGYEEYLVKILQGLQNLYGVLNQWHRVVVDDPSPEAKVCQLYKSHLEDARQGYKLTKRNLQRLEDLNIRLTNNRKKSENEAKKYLLLRDSLQKIARNEIHSVMDPQIPEQTHIIKEFIELFLSPNVLLELSDIKQILWIQRSLIGVINHTKAFAIDEYFKILMRNASSNLLCISHNNYAELIARACIQLEIKTQISLHPDLYFGSIAEFCKHQIVTEEILKPDKKDYQPSWLYQTTEKMIKALLQLILYAPEERFKDFIIQNISLFNTTNGFELAMNAWLQLCDSLEQGKLNPQIGHNILAAMDIFLYPDNHKIGQSLYNYVQATNTETTLTLVDILSLRSKRILNINFKQPQHIKYFFIPGVNQLFNVQYDRNSNNDVVRKKWATAWFYLNAYSPQQQAQKIDTVGAIATAQEIFPMFLRLFSVSPATIDSLIDFFQIISGYGNWQERHQLAKFLILDIKNIKCMPSQERLKSLQAKAVIKLFDFPSFLADSNIFKQLASAYLLHFCQKTKISRLSELNPQLQNYRNILQFPLKENFDLLYYFSDELASMSNELDPKDAIWAMKLLYRIFDCVDTMHENMAQAYQAQVTDLLESVQRFSRFYRQNAEEMPFRVLQGKDDLYLWKLKIPTEYAESTPIVYGEVLLEVQDNLIDYKLLDCFGKVISGQVNTDEANLGLRVNAKLSDLRHIKVQLFTVIAKQTGNLGWQALLMKQYLRIKETVRKQISAGFESLSDRQNLSLVEKMRDAILIIDGARNYKFSMIDGVVTKYLEEGLSASNIKQDIMLFFDDMVAAIAKVLSRGDKSLEDWSMAANSVDDRIKFICARKKYSESQFKDWFLGMNKQLNADKQSALMERYLQDVRGLNEKHQLLFTDLGIDFLQYNQEIAIAAVYQHLAQAKENTRSRMNLFMKLGTGQGKSLVIAEAARKILSEKLSKTVMIFTCYDHLAERDFNKFKSYFAHFGYNAACILPNHLDSSTSVLSNNAGANALAEFSKAQVIYVNLETYISLLRQERVKRIKQQETAVMFPDPKDSVAIMDEFDSLILDSDEIIQTLDGFQVPAVNLLALGKSAAERKVLADLDPTSIVRVLLRTIIGSDSWQSWYNEEWNQLVTGGRSYSDISSLGKRNNFKSALFDEWQFGCVTLLSSVIDPLSFYNSFKFVIGLSGSINRQTHRLISNVLTGDSNYFEIPPFFGPINAEKNRTQTKDLICNSQEQHVQSIIDEAVAITTKTERPVLIFAESTTRLSESKSDFEVLKERLCSINKIAKSKLLFVENESDINRHLPNIGKRKYVTLATRILARGADIKVDTDIKEGLHLIVGYYPDRESIYIQMLGRTARQDDKGSYATITRDPKDFKSLNSEKNVVDGICHRVSESVFADEKLPVAQQTGRQCLQAFPLFITAFRSCNSSTLEGKLPFKIEREVLNAFPRLRR